MSKKFAIAVAVAVALGACATGTTPSKIIPANNVPACSPGTNVALDAKAKVSVCGTVDPNSPGVVSSGVFSYKGIRYATAKRWE